MKTNINEFSSKAGTFGCEKCESLFLSQVNPKFCPICGSDQVQQVKNTAEYPKIELLITFYRNISSYEAKIQDFISRVKFKTEQLNITTIKKNGQWVFFPFWLVDSKSSGIWDAEFGFDYLVESSVEQLQQGEWISQKTNETRIDWKPRKGTIEKEYFNIPISAQSYFKQLSNIFGRYDLVKAHENNQDYKFTDQTTLILPNIDKTIGWQYAKEEFIKLIKNDCQLAAAAQHTKTFSPTKLQFSDQNWTLLLLPYFISHYLDEEGKPHSIWVNGQTLQINGDRFSSPAKGKKTGLIYLIISIFLFLFTLLFGYLTNFIVSVGLIALTCFLASIGFLIGSIYSFFYPSNWNKKNTITFNKAD